jgi:hypothetical protein
MPSRLHAAISELAAQFATSVLREIRGASLDEILAEGPGAPRRGPGRPRSTTPAAPKRAARSAPARKKASPAKTTAPAKKTSKGRLRRRSPADILKALGAVVELVKKNPKGLRAEQIRTQLKMEAKEMPRVLKEGLAKKTLKSKGQKRSTTYTAA